jgi:hypothetical protein
MQNSKVKIERKKGKIKESAIRRGGQSAKCKGQSAKLQLRVKNQTI